MKERPILFQAEMVRAILAGRKTVTRRVVKPQSDLPANRKTWNYNPFGPRDNTNHLYCPYGQPGDQLWVRETCLAWSNPGVPWPVIYSDHEKWNAIREDAKRLKADGFPRDGIGFWKMTPSIHMTRWASRIDLLVKSVRVERVQDISEDDAIAEGIESNDDDGVVYYGPFDKGHACPKHEFQRLWDSINKKRGFEWAFNPWVWVVEFEKL